MIQITELMEEVGGKVLFSDVSLSLDKNERYAIVGANGAGKSTLLRLLSQEDPPSFGRIDIAKSATVATLQQDQHLYEEISALEVVLRGKEELWQAILAKQKLLDSPLESSAIAHRLSLLEERIAHHRGYEAEPLIHKLLTGLGIDLSRHREPLGHFSGGYKLRVLLARALFQEPDILLLDEPTNYLDLDSIRWLESYLMRQYQGLLLFVSHDLSFIERVATSYLDIDFGEIRLYRGPYSSFQNGKKLFIEERELRREAVERKRKELQEFIEKWRAKASKARQALSRAKQLEKLELPDLLHSSRESVHFSFKFSTPSAHKVIDIKRLEKGFDEELLFSSLSFTLHRGDKLALIGPNGCGKSTLLHIIRGALAADEGEILFGTKVTYSYFAQELTKEISSDQPILEWLMEQSHSSEKICRQILALFLFRDLDVYKRSSILSGGEMARLLLAKIFLEESNLLLLDEPTNHLDLEMRLSLAKAVQSYKGSVIFVSHDEHFIEHCATRILRLDPSGFTDFSGPFAEYRAKYLTHLTQKE